MREFFEGLPMSGKIEWIILAVIVIVSTVRIIISKGRNGGIGAAIVFGLSIVVLLEQKKNTGLLKSWQDLTWYVRIPVLFILFNGIFSLCAFISGSF